MAPEHLFETVVFTAFAIWILYLFLKIVRIAFSVSAEAFNAAQSPKAFERHWVMYPLKPLTFNVKD